MVLFATAGGELVVAVAYPRSFFGGFHHGAFGGIIPAVTAAAAAPLSQTGPTSFFICIYQCYIAHFLQTLNVGFT